MSHKNLLTLYRKSLQRTHVARSVYFLHSLFLAVLWIWIRIGSVFRSFVDPDLYSQYGSGFL